MGYAALFAGYDVIDLDRAFRRDRIGLAWKFREDNHWNEFGNQLAAVQLFRYLERVLGLEPLPDDALALRLQHYYASFPLNWKPPSSPEQARPSEGEARAIRARYTGLERP